MTADPRAARILVVDDDPGILHALSRVLGRRYELQCVESPLAAIGEVADFAPDLAILDLRMPEMSGFELLRELHARLAGLDVILMTGSAEEPDANLVRAIDEGAFYFIQKPFDRRVLLALVARCLELRRLRSEKQAYTKRLELELDEARRFQSSLLPPEEIRLEDLSLRARYLACAELAGDFFDYIVDGDETVAWIVADVVGHGASAAMMTGIVKSAFRSSDVDEFDPQAVIRRIRDSIRVFDPGKFVTLVCARLNRRTRELSYVNAGHPAPILHGPSGRARLLDSTGPLISSALIEVPCKVATVSLEPLDCLFCYTDGLTEAQGPEGMFGRDRLLELISQKLLPHGKDYLDAVLAAVTEFVASRPFHDDITMLCLEMNG